MSKTKIKILNAARQLLNEQGLSKVSQRTIADYLRISPGNLTYHFKKRSDIIEALYYELVKKMDSAIGGIDLSSDLLASLFEFTKVNAYTFYDYRFLFLDFMQVMRENPSIKSHYFALQKSRQKQFDFFLSQLVEQGIMIKSSLPEEYRFLVKRLMIVADYWLSASEFESAINKEEKINQVITMSSQTIYPYLTDKGKRRFRMIVAPL